MNFAKTSFLSQRKNYPYKGLRAKYQECQMEKSELFPRNMLKEKSLMRKAIEVVAGPLQMSSSDDERSKQIGLDLAREGKLVKV